MHITLLSLNNKHLSNIEIMTHLLNQDFQCAFDIFKLMIY